MKLIFAGTPEFAATAFGCHLRAGHELALVLTQPDRPAGRGMALQASPVKQLAGARGIPSSAPSLKDAAAQAVIREVAADAMVVAAYGLILPQAVLDLPRPRLPQHPRLAAAPLARRRRSRAILAGDVELGVCIMQMEAGLDTGPVLLAGRTPITADDTAATLHDRLAALGGQLIVAALAACPYRRRRKAETGVTYAVKIDKAEV